MLPVEHLFERHRLWYEPGTLARFRAWFERSGYGAMLDNPYLYAMEGNHSIVTQRKFVASDFSGLTFRNGSASPWQVSAATDLSRGAASVKQLFHNFSLCIGHSHPMGDYRNYPAYYTRVHAGPRFLAFDGAGSCLLLGAMIQALGARLLDEKIDLHYSFATDRRLTHVFGTWKGQFFVDPDQKTWLPVDQVDDAAVYGYIFQQLGVSANALFSELGAEEQASLFSTISRAYFDFYKPSAFQYMSDRKQDTTDLCAMFRQARADSCTPCSIDASDFAWKDELRRYAAHYGIPHPYLLVRAEDPVMFEIPAHGALFIGLGVTRLPAEAELLCAIYLGRVPLSVNAPLVNGNACFDLPEIPWLLTFEPETDAVTVNGQKFKPRLSRDGGFRILGTGDLEPALGMMDGRDRFALNVAAPGDSVSAILPFNAFAASSGLMDFSVLLGTGRTVEGRCVA